jgi:hypothetical protein
VNRKRPALFGGRHFEDVIIMLCVRWYLRYSLSYRDLEEIMKSGPCLDRTSSPPLLSPHSYLQQIQPLR